MDCTYYQAGLCHSCTWIERPYTRQVADKQDAACQTLAGVVGMDSVEWLPPALSSESAFRTTAKMVVGGTTDTPTLGILGTDWQGVDLRECPIVALPIREALPGIARFITHCGLVPYDVARRSGELKYVLVTAAADATLLVRFVLRSRRQLAVIRQNLPRLRATVPSAAVVTANIHPIHEAVVEGAEEISLTSQTSLPLPVGDVVVQVAPGSFVQTNTGVAAQLYRQVGRWVVEGTGETSPIVGTDEGAPPGGLSRCRVDGSGPGEQHLPLGWRPEELWDLYCGVGGFALHAAYAGVPRVTGVEISSQAIDAARRAADALGLSPSTARFVAADATKWARRQDRAPDAVVVNPPRRGIGADLADWLDASDVRRVVYSSCFPPSLARDLAAMPRLRPVAARLFDMFPHTAHAEVAVLLERRLR